MSKIQQKYGRKLCGTTNVEESRFIRAEKYEESRKKQRSKAFNENRNIANSVTSSSPNKETQAPVMDDRLVRLQKWKRERERRKRMDQAKKRPPFVVGVVHHKVFSPITKDESTVISASHAKIHNPVVTVTPVPPMKKITKATEKRLKNKALAKKPTKIPIKVQTFTQKEEKTPKKINQSFAPNNHKFKAPVGLNQSPLFGRVVLQSMSPARHSFHMSSSRISLAKRKSNIAAMSIAENVEHKEEGCNDKKKIADIGKEDIDLKTKEEGFNETEEDSIEPISLKFSFDEEEEHQSDVTKQNETFTYSNTSDSKVDKSSSHSKELNNSKEVGDVIKKELNNSITNVLSSSKNNNSILSHSESPQEPAFFSPYIVSSRGKSNARKEEKLKRGFSLGRSPLEDHIPTKETVMKNLNISIDEEERTAQYFQFLLNREIDRLNDICKKWTEIKEQPETTEDGQYEINQAIGQTNLLISKKFERFRGLVADCETGKGEMLVTCKDLQGFWDMMYMEIKNCDLRFEKLENLRAQGWIEVEAPVDTKKITKKKTTVKKKVAPTKSSSIRAFLAEKKKKVAQEMKDGNNMDDVNMIQISNTKFDKIESPSVKNKLRRSMSIASNENKFTPKKPEKRLSLLQKVQLSETSKKVKSPLTIIKVSQMCKTPEVQLDDTISYVNSDQTPAKSILKQPKNSNESEFRGKSTNKVNFNDQVELKEVPIDEEGQVKKELAAAFALIDSFNFDEPQSPVISGRKKLTFDDNSFDETTENEELHSKDKPNMAEEDKTPPEKIESIPKSRTSTPRRLFRRQNAVDEGDEVLNEPVSPCVTLNPSEEADNDKDSTFVKQTQKKSVSICDKDETDEHDESVRVLRNRTITSVDKPQSRRRSSRKMSVSGQESEQKENATPSGRRSRRSTINVKVETEEKKNLHNYVDALTLDETTNNRRRSTRSVKFTEKVCNGCMTSKPPLPVTPHVRRSKAQSAEKKKRSIVEEDLISWDTPEKPPERIRRSHSKKV